MLFGYDWGVIGGAKPFYEPYFDLVGPDKAWLSGWAMSSALAGCLAGALLSGALTDSLCRKKRLIFAAVLFTASAAWTALAQSFIAARILGGIGIGLASNVSPIYIAEVSPTSMWGKFVSLNQLTIAIGVLAAQVVNLGSFNQSVLCSMKREERKFKILSNADAIGLLLGGSGFVVGALHRPRMLSDARNSSAGPLRDAATSWPSFLRGFSPVAIARSHQERSNNWAGQRRSALGRSEKLKILVA